MVSRHVTEDLVVDAEAIGELLQRRRQAAVPRRQTAAERAGPAIELPSLVDVGLIRSCSKQVQRHVVAEA